jgi:hypothetical protein
MVLQNTSSNQQQQSTGTRETYEQRHPSINTIATPSLLCIHQRQDTSMHAEK